MTAVTQVEHAFALTPEWVRTLVAALAANACCNEKSRPLRTDEPATLADVTASVGGDGEAYARIIHRYQGAIARRMYRFSHNSTDVDALVHDVFVEAYFSLRRFRDDAPLEHWLQRIATRVGYRYWQRQRHDRSVSLRQAVHDCAAESPTANNDLVDEVPAILQQLPPRDRLVLTLLYIESRSVAETAQLAGWSQTMVKVQAYRARKKFRKLLEKSTTL